MHGWMARIAMNSTKKNKTTLLQLFCTNSKSSTHLDTYAKHIQTRTLHPFKHAH